MYYIQKSSEEKKLFVSEFLGLSASRKCDSNLRRCVKSVFFFFNGQFLRSVYVVFEKFNLEKFNLESLLGWSRLIRLQIFRYTCCYCSWSGVDNWCLKRHLNTHLKPFACTLCEYKAARAERLATHVLKVHNRRQCSRCSFLGEDAAQLQMHQLHVHRVSSANAPATSSAQAAPPPTNRHQQPLQ